MSAGEIVHHVANGLLGAAALCLVVLTLNYYFMGPSRRFRERLDWETSKATRSYRRRCTRPATASDSHLAGYPEAECR